MDYDQYWLEIDDNENYPNFRAIKLKEIDGQRDLVKEHLVSTLLDHFTKPDRVENYIKSLNYDKLASYVFNRVPTKDKVRKGDFGEIIGVEHLCQRYKYESPIFKLRYNPNPNTAMHGEDIIAFKIFKDKIIGICIGESKTMKNLDHRAVKNAHNQLKSSYKPHPTSLSFISDRLLEENNEDLANQVENILAILGYEKFPRDNWIFIITGNKPRDPFNEIKKIPKAEIVENLIVVNLHLPDLSVFVNELFEECINVRKYAKTIP